jgi:chaperonin GroES
MNIRPLHDRVIVKRLDDSETMRGMLYIPDSAKEKPQQAEVKAVGTGRRSEKGERVAMEVKPGDRVLFGKYGGSEVKVDGEEWLILREDEILAVLD